MPNLGIPAMFQPQVSLEQYGQNPFLYPAASVIAQEAARVELLLKKKKLDGKNEDVFDHQSLELLAKPMPMKNGRGRSHMTGYQLRVMRNLHLLLDGEAFWLLDDFRSGEAGGAPQAIYPLNPGSVDVKIGTDYLVKEYVYMGSNGNKISYPPEAIVHFKMVNPVNPFRGHSPTKSARWALDSYRQAEEMNFNRLKNNAFPDGVLHSEQKIPEKERESMLAKFLAKFAGPKNKNRIGFMPYGVKYQDLEKSNKDMQFIELLEKAERAILANWRVPVDLLGITKDNTRANAEAALFTFLRYTVLPLVELEVDALTADFLPMFPDSSDKFYGFDDFVPENMDDKRKNMETLFGIGSLKPNEAREEFGYDQEKKPEMDETYLPFNVTPVSTISLEKPVVPPALDPNKPPVTPPKEMPPAEKKPVVKVEPKKQAAGDFPDDLLNEQEETDALGYLALPFLIRGFTRGVELAKSSKSKINPSDLLTPTVRDALKNQAFDMAAYSAGTTTAQMRELLAEAIANGWSPARLSKEIKNRYEVQASNDALRIARTELTGALNNGQFRTLQADGYLKKEWVAIMDARVRDSHASANGQTVSLVEPFVLDGGTAQFPGDPGLPAEERINCRCDIVGAGLSPAAQASHLKQFLRLHGTLEAQFVAALVREFQRQRDRALSRLSS